MTPKEALHTAISLCGGQVSFAAALTAALHARGVNRVISQQIVSYWTRSLYSLPSHFCIDVEELPQVNFQVTKHMLRPDVFGDMPYVPINDTTA